MKLKEKISKNEKYQKLKEKKQQFDVIWSNPKSHAKIMLSFWFIIVLILSLMVRIGDNKTNYIEEPKNIEIEEKVTSDSIKNELKNIKSYEATIIINDIEEFNITKVLDEKLITYQNDTYYYKDTLELLINNELVKVENSTINDILYFDAMNIYESIKNEQEEYITIYKDNSYVVVYDVPLKNRELVEQQNVKIVLTGTNKISKIELSNLQNDINKITINLENINNIEKINLNIKPQE